MRVAFVTFDTAVYNGGAGVYATHVTEELAKLGHQCCVHAGDGNTDNTEHPLV